MYQRKNFDFSSHGAFFAFSQEQFDKAKKEGVDYVSVGQGLILPKNKAKEIIELFDQFNRDERKRRIEIEGINKIIAYELSNYECYYTGDLSDLQFLVDDYGCTREQIREIYNENLSKQENF